MPEHIVSYEELEDFKPPKGEEIVSYDPDQNGAWRVVTESKSK